MLSLFSPLFIGFMDDITLGSTRSLVAADVELFKAEESKISLDLNVSKCETISRSHNHPIQTFQVFLEITLEDACLLGASLGTGRALDKALSSRCSDLRIAIGRLKVLLSYMPSYCSNHRSVSLGKCTPFAVTHAWDTGHSVFNNLLQEGITIITNSLLSDIQWLQASLPVRDEGLGIHLATSLALSAFLASATSTSDLQYRILSSRWSMPGVEYLAPVQVGLQCTRSHDLLMMQQQANMPGISRHLHVIGLLNSMV